MSNKTTKRTLATAIGAALVGSMSVTTGALAAENPFGLQELGGGYMQVAMNEGKCGGDKKTGEAKCGGDKKAGEAKCGGDKKAGEGKCGGDKKAGEGKSGGDKKAGEGKCGGDKTTGEGKCGEGTCGARK